ncbi:MAG TPA: PadR family transcriptional regulator [Streptosporangiaceae bacterium]
MRSMGGTAMHPMGDEEFYHWAARPAPPGVTPGTGPATGHGAHPGHGPGGHGAGPFEHPPGPPFAMPFPPRPGAVPAPPPVPPPPMGWGMWHRAAPKAKRGDVRAAVLSLLAEEPRNGYQIIQEIAERSGGLWKPSPGSVYPALQQLEDEGLIRAEPAAGGRKVFRLTDEGGAYVAEHADELAAPWAAIAETVDDRAVEVHTLFSQLYMAVGQATQAATAEQLAEVHKVLAGARRAIYAILAADPADES